MSRVSDLIRELCPNGVEFRALDELFVIRNGYTPSKSNPGFWENGSIPWFRMDDIRTNGRILNDSLQHVTPAAIKGRLFAADSIILATTATIGEHALITADSLANQRFTVFTKREPLGGVSLDMKFVYYYFYIIGEWCKRNTKVSSFAAVDMTKLKKYKMPVPPLVVQQEIVGILDKFSDLTANLTTELAARRSQYEYYRDRLLTVDTFESSDEIQYMELKNCVGLVKNIKWKERVNEECLYIDLTSVDRDTHSVVEAKVIDSVSAPSRAQQIVQTHDVLLGTTRPMLRRYCYITDEYDGEICSTGFCVLRPDTSIILPKWLYHNISSNVFFSHVEKLQKGASYPSISDADVKAFVLPVPPLEEQERIVSILDQFEVLCSDLSIGLPAEIEARQKQYEYYRDKLLTFKPITKQGNE